VVGGPHLSIFPYAGAIVSLDVCDPRKLPHLTIPTNSIRDIENDLTFVFTTPNPTLSIIHGPLLLNSLRIPEERARLQSAAVFAALALATLMRSSAVELGAAGSARALWLREAAGAHLEAALKVGRVDAGLAQAALLLALFEASAHSKASGHRELASLRTLDHVISTAGLLTADSNDGASMFSPRTAPIVIAPPPSMWSGTSPAQSAFDSGSPHTGGLAFATAHGVAQSASSFGSSPSSSTDVNSPAFNTAARCTCSRTANFGTPAWQGWELTAGWTPNQIRREEARRTVWAALGLAAAHAVRCVVFDMEVHSLGIFEPGNVSHFCLFFTP
jgi:hypothetical protein